MLNLISFDVKNAYSIMECTQGRTVAEAPGKGESSMLGQMS